MLRYFKVKPCINILGLACVVSRGLTKMATLPTMWQFNLEGQWVDIFFCCKRESVKSCMYLFSKFNMMYLFLISILSRL